MWRFGIVSTLFVLTFATNALADDRHTIRHFPDREMSAPAEDRSTWDYIPKDLTDAHVQLERLIPKEELQRIDEMKSEDQMIVYHRNLGMHLRNEWGLWRGSRLADEMRRLGFHHPDDMSAVIFQTLWCKRHQKDFAIEQRAEYYEKYWEAYSAPPKDLKDLRDGSEIKWYQILDTGDDKHPAAVHIGKSTKTGKLVAYEFGKGVYLPKGDLLKRVRDAAKD